MRNNGVAMGILQWGSNGDSNGDIAVHRATDVKCSNLPSRSHFGSSLLQIVMKFRLLPALACVVCLAMSDELADLIAMQIDGPVGRLPLHVLLDGVDDEHEGEQALALELRDLHDMQIVAAERPVRAYGQRSWQLLDKARGALGVKRQKLNAETETAKKLVAEAKLDFVSGNFPLVARMIGIPARRGPMDERRARTVMQLAFGKAFRQHNSFMQMQDRASSTVALACLASQRDYLQKFLAPPEAPAAASEPSASDQPSGPTSTLLALEWQWDETSA